MKIESSDENSAMQEYLNHFSEPLPRISFNGRKARVQVSTGLAIVQLDDRSVGHSTCR